MSKNKWDSPAEWLLEKCDEWTEGQIRGEFKALVRLLDQDTIQDEFQSDMIKDGFFEKEDIDEPDE